MTYDPRTARVGEPTPQTNPEMFTRDELIAEAKHLMALNRRHGAHPLRTAAYLRLLNLAELRTSDDHRTCAEAIRSCSGRVTA